MDLFTAEVNTPDNLYQGLTLSEVDENVENAISEAAVFAHRTIGKKRDSNKITDQQVATAAKNSFKVMRHAAPGTLLC